MPTGASTDSVSGVMPASSAARKTNGLKAEPGWRSAWVARLNWLAPIVAAADHRADRAVGPIATSAPWPTRVAGLSRASTAVRRCSRRALQPRSSVVGRCRSSSLLADEAGDLVERPSRRNSGAAPLPACAAARRRLRRSALRFGLALMKPASTMSPSTTLARARCGDVLVVGGEARRRLQQAGDHRGLQQRDFARRTCRNSVAPPHRRHRCRRRDRRGSDRASRIWSLVKRRSSHSASSASWILRLMVRSGVRNRFLASCWVMVLPPWTTRPAREVHVARPAPGRSDRCRNGCRSAGPRSRCTACGSMRGMSRSSTTPP